MDQHQVSLNRRVQFDEELREIQINCLGYQHTYFEPTEQTRLQYDAILYKNAGMDAKHADNRNYYVRNSWQVICISRDPETAVPRAIVEHFERCRPGTPYVADNLYHFPFTIYY